MIFKSKRISSRDKLLQQTRHVFVLLVYIFLFSYHFRLDIRIRMFSIYVRIHKREDSCAPLHYAMGLRRNSLSPVELRIVITTK